MSYGNQQREEIKTIRERTITVKLSDADCQRLAEKAAKVGESIDTLMANFIGDLVDGTYTNGSDEVMCAQNWYERTYFIPSKTFLSYLVQYGDLNDVIEMISDIKYMKEDIKIVREELRTGKLASGGTWEDLERRGSGFVKPAYSSKEEWESEQRDYIEQAEENIKSCESSINDYWEDYIQFFKPEEPNMDKEIRNVLEWSNQLAKFKGENSFDAAIEEAMQVAEVPEPEFEIEM